MINFKIMMTQTKKTNLCQIKKQLLFKSLVELKLRYYYVVDFIFINILFYFFWSNIT